MTTDHQERVSDQSNQFDNCAPAQSVLLYDSAGDRSSEGSALGAFLLAAIEILVQTDLEGGNNGNGSTN